MATKAVMATHRALHLITHDKKQDATEEAEDNCNCLSDTATECSTVPLDKCSQSHTLDCGNGKCGNEFHDCPRDGRSGHDPDKDDKVEDCLVKELSAQFKENFIGLG